MHREKKTHPIFSFCPFAMPKPADATYQSTHVRPAPGRRTGPRRAG
ncbi:hypothetical protein SSCG_02892 [Streptomyces clavuligerus]|nr:hypothetical protein SSCG_02892 [Streptomyces clavuligerus]